jgi:hypothetical protein
VVWADGLYQGTYTVANTGVITLPNPVSNACVGLGYQAQFKGAKLAEQPILLSNKKRIDHLSVVLQNTHYQGLLYGGDFTTMDELPLVEQEAVTAPGTVWATYDNVSFELDGLTDPDARLCLVANAPLPCTIVALCVHLTTGVK